MIGKIKNKLKEVNNRNLEQKRSDELYAIGALFDTPDEIMDAAGKTTEAGYEEFDVNTPYPVHGMDQAMKLKNTMVGKTTFIFGFLGTTAALLMIGWMSGIDYQNIIGGKPFFAIPPAIPITFELTVLLGGLATAGLMLTLFNRLPWINNPLHDTNYIKQTASDKFGLVIYAKDKNFNIATVEGFLQSIGGKSIEKINFFEVREDRVRTPIFDFKFIALLAVVTVVTAVTAYGILRYVLFLPPFDFMWKQEKVLPQEKSTFFADGFSMRPPVEGTVSRGSIPYEYQGLPDSVVTLLANPLPINAEVLAKGKQRFNTYCSPCHGYYGEGDSRLRGQFPNPPSLHTDKVRQWADGNIYHVITNGQNVMSSYAKQISRDDRWAIVHYIRALQRALNAKDEDLN